MVEQALRIAVGDIVLAVLRRDANARARRADGGSDRVDHFEQEARAVLDAAAVSVGALVGAVAQELIDQIAIGAVHLDAVEPCGDRVLRGACAYWLTMPGISASSNARGFGIGSKPLAVKACPLGWSADGATGSSPPGWKD